MSNRLHDDWITVHAPGTISNVGPGFDCFGFAQASLLDAVSVRWRDEPGIAITRVEPSDGVPLDPSRNTAAVAASGVLQHHRAAIGERGIEMIISKGFPPCSGLGSSAASAAAGAEAAMQLVMRETGSARDVALVLESALDGETASAGVRHADNVAPAVLGGFVIVLSVSPLAVRRIDPPDDWWIGFVLPDIRIATAEARALLPDSVPLPDAIHNWARTAAIVAGIMDGDLDFVGTMLADRVVEPRRAALVPGYDDARAAAHNRGAVSCNLSGSGPAMFSLAASESIADAAATAMAEVFSRGGISCSRAVSRMSGTGVRTVE